MMLGRFFLTLFVIGAAFDLTAGDFRDRYCSVIGPGDRVNSSGERLQSVAAIIAQERANYHNNTVRHVFDDFDQIFQTQEMRALLPQLIEEGSYSRRDEILIVGSDMPLEYCLYIEGRDYPEITEYGATVDIHIDIINYREFTY